MMRVTVDESLDLKENKQVYHHTRDNKTYGQVEIVFQYNNRIKRKFILILDCDFT